MAKGPLLNITNNGELVGKERREPRFDTDGIILLHCPNNKTIRATCRDVSPTGIGVKVHKKLKGYRLGSRIGLEFAHPHKLQGLLIEVELMRVNIDPEGHNHIGFRILTSNRLLKKRLGELLAYIERSDPWKVSPSTVKG